MYTVGRYISQGVYTVAGPFHPFGGAVDIIVVEQEDGTFKSTPWYVKFGKFQGVLKRREKVVDVAVNGNDVNFHMYLDATGEAYFLKDADSDTEVSILSPPSAASSGDDIVVETLAVEAVKPDNNVQAKVEIQESQEAAEKPCSRGEKKEILELTLESRDLSSVLVHEVPASQYELSETVLASPHQDEVASDTGIDVEDGAPDGSSNRDEHGVANGQSDKGQVSDELLSTARGSARHVNTAEGQKTIHALLNHAIGLDPFCESGPAGSLVANAALSALEKVATVQPPSTLLRNSNQALPVVHFIREVTGSSLQGSNSLDSRLVETLPKVEFLRNRSGHNLNGPSGITIASADGGMILEAPCTEELGVVHSKLAQQGQWPSEADPTVSAPQHNQTFDPLNSPHTRPECSDLLVETEHEVSEEHKEKKDWNGARTLSKPTEVVEHTSKSGHVEPSENENDKYDADCALDGIAFGSLSGENGEMMQGAGEELPECRVLPSTAEREALQVEVAGSEVHWSAPSNGSVGDPLSGLQDSTLEKMQISSEIEPNLEDTRSLDVMEGSIRLKETTEIGHANEPVVSVPSEENPTSSIEEGDPSPSLKAAVAREMAWRDATEKAAAVLRTSPLCTKSHQTRRRVDRRIKPGGSLRSLPEIIGHNQNLPSNSTPAALDKNMDSQELSKLAQKKADVTEQSERKPWIWWNWRATPSLPKQSSDQVEKKETKEVKGTTNQAGEDNMQTSSYAPDADSHSSTSIDVRSSTMKEANKMLREDDSRVSTEEVVVNSTKQSLTVAMRNKEGLAEQKMKNRGPEEEENQEEKREEFTPEVESSNAVQKSEPKGVQEENNEEFTLGVESSTTIQKSQGKEAENLARRSILGIVFRGYGRERPLAGPDCALERVSSLQTAEIVSDLLDNSWGYGSGGKSRQGTANNSQATAVSSSLNSQCMAAVSNSKSKTSDSQRSFTAETMGPEEEPVTNERTDVPANKYSTLNSSLHLQGGEGSRTEAADNSGNSGLSEPSSTDADSATTADCPSFVGIDIAAGEKGPEIVTDEDTLQDSGETGLQGERSNAKNNDSGSVRASSMSMKEKLSGLSLGATTTSAVLMEEVEGSSNKVKIFNLPDRLQDEVSQDAASVSTFSQEVVSPHECTRRVSFPVAVDSLTTGHRQHDQKVVAENAYLKDLAVLSVEDLVGPDKEWSSNSAAEVVLVSGTGSFVMAPVDPMGPCSIEDSTSAAPVLFSDEEKPSNKEGNAVDDSDLQGSISERRVPALSPVQDEIMATGVGSSSTELLHKNLALLQASPMQDGAHDTQINVVQVAQPMPVGTEVLEIVKAVKAIPETREMDEVVTKTNELNRSEGELKKPLSYRGTGAASRNSIYFEAYNSEQEEEEGHGKVAVGEIDHLGITSHGENESDDEIENPLSYNDVGSASRTSIYFEANTSEEEDDEDHAQVVDADVDLETSRRQSDPIGIPVTVENLARDELYVVAKDRPLSESLPDVMFESVDRDISDIQSALSRSVGSEPLRHTQRSAGRRDSSLENYVRSPAEGTHEQLEGFMENIEKKGVRSLVGSGSSKDESSGEDGAEPDGVETATETGVELSLCRHLLKEHMGMEEAAEAFTSARVSLHEFKNSSASIMANDKLIIRVGGQYYPWNVAAPIALGILAFGQVIMPVTDSAIPVERPEPVEKSQAVGTLVPTATGGWKLWPFPLRRPRTPEQGIATNSLASRDAFLETAGTAVPSPFVNNSHLQNGYYERPRKNKVRTIIPTSQMLAQMNLKEGSNRITFTFFTRMLGKQQVDARVYLWKWNTRIVISDVDGTITKSDVLGQVMPLVGKDWTQSGVARLFSSIKENGYELLFLSARAISQADLTRQFLFNVKQDGETLPNGPVVISPDGLFPSLYREVIRRTPHEFKIACLQDIRSLFPEDCNPFYAGFGNRDTDEISYLKVGIPKGKVFIINPRGEVAVNNRVDVRTYTSLHKLVNDMFPAQTYVEQEDYNLWNFWKLPLPDIEDELKSVSASSSKRS